MFISVDFNNRDYEGMLRLNTFGTSRDLEARAIVLFEGLELQVSDGDLFATIVVREPGEEKVWRGQIIGEIGDIDRTEEQ